MSVLAESGLDGLNVRAVAGRLEASAGSLYTYFENKQAILDAIMARALKDVATAKADSGDWRADLRAVMLALHHAFSQHPAVITLLAAGVGAEGIDPIREALLSLLAQAGLPPRDRVRAQNLLVSLAVGDAVVRHSHLRDTRGPELDRRRLLPRERYPHLHQSAHARIEEPGTETYIAGLDALLGAVEEMRPVG